MAINPPPQNPDQPQSSVSNQSPSPLEPRTMPSEKEDEKGRGSDFVRTKLRNIVLWVAVAAGSVGINFDNAVDYFWPPPPPPPAVVVLPSQQARQEARNITEELKRILKDIADDRISVEEAAKEVIKIIQSIMPTDEALNERIKQILQKAKDKGTQRAWAEALDEILQLIRFTLGGNTTPTPTPTPTVNVK
jgi:hypothetical protein